MDYPRAGFIYVLQMEGLPYYKIGRTTDLSRRVGQISPKMPGRLIIVLAHKVPDAWRIESDLHKDFSDRRLNAEWFNLDLRCLDEIRAALLFVQADAVIERLIHRLNTERASESLVFGTTQALGRVLEKAAQRAQRRISAYADRCNDRSKIPSSDQILSAEFIG
jgi:hypothetical protein